MLALQALDSALVPTPLPLSGHPLVVRARRVLAARRRLASSFASSFAHGQGVAEPSPSLAAQHPPLSALAPPPAPTVPALPASAWHLVRSKSDPTGGSTYWYNPKTGESRWEPPPRDGAASAAGAPQDLSPAAIRGPSPVSVAAPVSPAAGPVPSPARAGSRRVAPLAAAAAAAACAVTPPSSEQFLLGAGEARRRLAAAVADVEALSAAAGAGLLGSSLEHLRVRTWELEAAEAALEAAHDRLCRKLGVPWAPASRPASSASSARGAAGPGLGLGRVAGSAAGGGLPRKARGGGDSGLRYFTHGAAGATLTEPSVPNHIRDAAAEARDEAAAGRAEAEAAAAASDAKAEAAADKAASEKADGAWVRVPSSSSPGEFYWHNGVSGETRWDTPPRL